MGNTNTSSISQSFMASVTNSVTSSITNSIQTSESSSVLGRQTITITNAPGATFNCTNLNITETATISTTAIQNSLTQITSNQSAAIQNTIESSIQNQMSQSNSLLAGVLQKNESNITTNIQETLKNVISNQISNDISTGLSSLVSTNQGIVFVNHGTITAQDCNFGINALLTAWTSQTVTNILNNGQVVDVTNKLTNLMNNTVTQDNSLANLPAWVYAVLVVVVVLGGGYYILSGEKQRPQYRDQRRDQ